MSPLLPALTSQTYYLLLRDNCMCVVFLHVLSLVYAGRHIIVHDLNVPSVGFDAVNCLE